MKRKEKIAELRQKDFDTKGCGFWKLPATKSNCCFPRCFCYPYWREKFNIQDDKEEKP